MAESRGVGCFFRGLGVFVRCQRPQKEVQQEDKSFIETDHSETRVPPVSVLSKCGALRHKKGRQSCEDCGWGACGQNLQNRKMNTCPNLACFVIHGFTPINTN